MTLMHLSNERFLKPERTKSELGSFWVHEIASKMVRFKALRSI